MSYYFNPAQEDGVTYGPLGIASAKVPTREDWERHRPLIKRLYVDEGKKLQEVMAIMRQYGHNATPKMFKDRIKKWGIGKNNKERDMVAILRKDLGRRKIGKNTSYRFRGQVITMERVLHYLKRKRAMEEIEVTDAPTPSQLSYWTPSPSPTPQPVIEGSRISPGSSDMYSNSSIPLETANANAEAGGKYSGWEQCTSSLPEKRVIEWSPNNIYKFLSDNSSIPCSPLPPQTFLVPERLLNVTKIYFDVSFKEKWITGADGYCHSFTSTGDLAHRCIHEFQEYCWMAFRLLQGGMLLEFRRVMSKAFSLIQDILQLEHPQTLPFFLGEIDHLQKGGFRDLAGLLRNYIANMAKRVLAKDSLWGQLCQLIDLLDVENLQQTLLELWSCTIDAFRNGLGPLHPSTILVSLLSYEELDSLMRERKIREMLAQYEKTSDTFSPAYFGIMLELGRNLLDQGRWIEAESQGFNLLSFAEPESYCEVCTLDFITYSQYMQQKNFLAEENLRKAFNISVKIWGKQAPLTIHLIIRLEKWLRKWGRKGEADELRADINTLIARDEIDTQDAEE